LNDEIEKKINLKNWSKKYQSQPVFTFKTRDPSHELETNPIKDKT
jgi:hypothetical protein